MHPVERLLAEAFDLIGLEQLLRLEDIDERSAPIREGAQTFVERLLGDQALLQGQNADFRFFFQHVGLILGRK
jgi:hypothetical protein